MKKAKFTRSHSEYLDKMVEKGLDPNIQGITVTGWANFPDTLKIELFTDDTPTVESYWHYVVLEKGHDD